MAIKTRGVFFVFLLIILAATVSEASWRNRKAPEFNLIGLNGKRVSLADMRGRVVFIDFWASWCPPCKKEFPELKKLTTEYKGEEFVTLAISEDKRRANVKDFTSRYSNMPANLIVLLDNKSEAIKKYSVAAMPTSFIIDAKGVIRYVHYGYNESDPHTWRSEINTLIK